MKELSTRAAVYLVSLIVVVFLLRVSDHFRYTPDDTYIYLQYARNISEGNGWAFNTGEPTYGFTSPLWLALIASAAGVGLDAYVFAKVTDIIAAVAALLVLFVLSLRLTGRRYMAVMIVLCFSVNLWFVRWTGTGMETSFSVLLALLAVGSFLDHRPVISGLVTGLLVLTRPEAAVLAVLALLAVVLGSPKGQRIATSIRYGLGCGVPVLVWLGIAYEQFGSIIPNTARAKAGFKLEFEDLTHNMLDIGKTIGVADGLAMIVLVVGVVAILLRRNADSLSWLAAHAVPLLWTLALPVLYLVTSANVVSRYLLIMTPFILIYAFVVIEKLSTPSLRYAAVLAVLLLAQNVVLYEWRVKPSIEAFQQGMDECFVAIGKWLKEHTLEDAVVYVADIGAIGYFSERRVCDGAGLVTPEFIPYIREGYSPQHILEPDILRKVCNPDYVVHRASEDTRLDEPGFRALFSLPFHGLGLSDMRTVYYTVYETVREESGVQ